MVVREASVLRNGGNEHAEEMKGGECVVVFLDARADRTTRK